MRRLHFDEPGEDPIATKAMRIRTADEVLYLDPPPGVAGYELVDGELVEVMPAGVTHGRLTGEVYARVREHVQRYGGGRVYIDVGYVLPLPRDPERLRGPDVSFVSNESIAAVGGEPTQGFFHGAPDLAIEIESPNRPPALQQRIHDYLDAGTRLVWVIHSLTHSATVYHPDGTARLLRETDVLDGEDVLPGLQIRLDELFQA